MLRFAKSIVILSFLMSVLPQGAKDEKCKGIVPGSKTFDDFPKDVTKDGKLKCELPNIIKMG